jgi:hypothetical protein
MAGQTPRINFTELILRMTFEAYLSEKKIDPAAFRMHEPQRWEEFQKLFEQVHPNSFTAQKKFLINDLRRRYHLVSEEKAEG